MRVYLRLDSGVEHSDDPCHLSYFFFSSSLTSEASFFQAFILYYNLIIIIKKNKNKKKIFMSCLQNMIVHVYASVWTDVM